MIRFRVLPAAIAVLLLACAVRLTAGEGEGWAAFQPAENGVVPLAWTAGPFDAPSPALEGALPAPGGALPDGWEAVGWQLAAAGSMDGYISLPASAVAGGVGYLFAALRLPAGYQPFLLCESTVPFRFTTRSTAGESAPAEGEGAGRHLAQFPLVTGEPFLIRFALAAEGAKWRAVPVAERAGRPVLLRSTNVLLLVPGTHGEALRTWLAERLLLDAQPKLPREGAWTLRLRWGAAAPLPRGKLRARLTLTAEPEGAALLPAPLDLPLAEESTRDGASLRCEIPDLSRAEKVRVRLELFDNETPYASVEQLYPTASSLSHRIQAYREELRAAEAERGRSFPLGRLEILRLQAAEKRMTEGLFALETGDPLALLERAGQELAVFRAGEDPLADRRGLVAGAYISPVDGSVQPYRLYIPTHWKKEEALPLVILYHGYVPRYDRTDWMEITPGMVSALEEAGAGMLLTFGRSNTDFLSVGEVDTFDALADVQTRYRIDPARLYLAGFSMGGSGVWTTLTHYPGRFAAARIWSGRTDYYFWHDLDRNALPPYISYAIDTDNPVAMPENLRGVALFVTHPQGDSLVKPGHTQRMQEALLAAGQEPPARIELLPGGHHWLFSEDLEKAETYRWLLTHRKEERPKKVRIRTYTPKYGKNAWFSIDEIARWGSPAYAEAEVNLEKSTIHLLSLVNVSRIAIDEIALSPARKGEGQGMRLLLPEGWSANRLENTVGKEGWACYAVRHPDQKTPEGSEWRKGPERCGPVKEAFNQPFLLVTGTVGSAEETETNAAMADRFAEEWLAFAKGEARRCSDTAVTPEDEAAYNLVCFGTSRSNGVLRRLASRLPFHFPPAGYGARELSMVVGADKEAGGGKNALVFSPAIPIPSSRRGSLSSWTVSFTAITFLSTTSGTWSLTFSSLQVSAAYKTPTRRFWQATLTPRGMPVRS